MAKNFGFTYIFCNDLEKMKWFYSEILHLDLIWDTDSSIAYNISGHQLSISFSTNYKPSSPKYASQPGWKGGTEPRTSWSIEYKKEDFNESIKSVLNNDIPTFYKKPKWNGYWSFPILDPMNNTIEITCTEKNI